MWIFWIFCVYLPCHNYIGSDMSVQIMMYLMNMTFIHSCLFRKEYNKFIKLISSNMLIGWDGKGFLLYPSAYFYFLYIYYLFVIKNLKRLEGQQPFYDIIQSFFLSSPKYIWRGKAKHYACVEFYPKILQRIPILPRHIYFQMPQYIFCMYWYDFSRRREEALRKIPKTFSNHNQKR